MHKEGTYDELARIHFDNEQHFAGQPLLLPWLRAYLAVFQEKLHAIDPNVTVPYWDWSRDSKAPQRSAILSNTYFGGNGGRGDGRPVTSGPFANWIVKTPTPHQLGRDFSNGSSIPAWTCPDDLDTCLQRSSYDDFRQAIETGPKASVHAGVGGRVGDMSDKQAPNDPLFWSHIAFVDLLWAEWQARNPDQATDFPGDADQHLAGLGTRKVADTFDTKNLGYVYPRWSAQPVL
ncbi:tyrosinase family protein [Streptomyces sp. NPDC000075]